MDSAKLKEYYKNLIKLAFPRGLFYRGPANVQVTELIEALRFARTELADNNLPHIIDWAYRSK